MSTEQRYSSFPTAVRASDLARTPVAAYRVGTYHASADGYTAVRRLVGAWSDPIVAAPNPGGGYAFTPCGMAVAGSRIWLALVKYAGTDTGSASDFSAWTTYSDDHGLTWSTPSRVPDVVAGWTYPSSLHVSDDGTLRMALYAKATTTGARWVGHVLRLSGTSWVAQGLVPISQRDVQEPQLCQLADGRLLMMIRSDGGQYNSRLYRAYSSDAGVTWSTPAMTLDCASGMPPMTRLPSGEIAVLYRGWLTTNTVTSPEYPLRLLMLDPQGVPYRSGIDVVPGDYRRYLYGSLLAGDVADPDLLVWSAEADLADPIPSAQVCAVPLTWGEY